MINKYYGRTIIFLEEQCSATGTNYCIGACLIVLVVRRYVVNNNVHIKKQLYL